MKTLLLIWSIIFCGVPIAHAQYVTSGKIEYERKINEHAKMKDNEDENGGDSWYLSIRSEMAKFDISYFDLTFNRNKSLYKPGKEVENKTKSYSDEPGYNNIVYTDLDAKKVKALKAVFEQKFLVQDSMRKMDWHLKDEIRTIANFKCRKAVGIICDSVYVVAFFTEDIAASSGPEMFGNLPGMILELAIPRLHTTWTATKVELVPTADADFNIAEKGKKVNSKELLETVKNSLKDWGKWGTRYIWLTAL